ncbi:protein ESMERALDA 1 [Selaginella moellendorffii]|uniref:protein ESMERALDA 1 n=1 Tax=Selaginella moellendorffii TaxID=88036 RepID=UPI000D1C5F12|nr:protein ESMERALDA 1 [Selaginella moellendorffii]|eukprot:XP_024533068.1 protein ESMERALDA 1 [Selaginella moellendorffii]
MVPPSRSMQQQEQPQQNSFPPPLSSSPSASTNGRSSGSGSGSKRSPSSSSRTLMQRLSCLVLSILLRQHKLLLIAPIIYISGMLLYMSTMTLDLPRVRKPDPPGSRYRSPEVFANLWPAMRASNNTGIKAVWQFPKEGEGWVPCLDRHSSNSTDLPPSNGFVMIEANGGLNQQRSSICNAVAVAALLNATLVVPEFHFNSVWQDRSTFGEIYDEQHFINALQRDVRVVSRLPDDLMDSVGNLSNIFNFRIKALSPPSFYLDKVLPKLLETGVIRIAPFANRLAYDHIPLPLQRLRCFTNYEALRFAKPISDIGQLLVQRMVERSSGNGGKYVAVHLRFEEDMVAFSCCIYDGGEEEKQEMDAAREKGWKGKFNRKGRIISPGGNRMDGKCPLTPLEVGMMLRGMGFKNSTPIFLAAGKIYKEERTMLPLKQMFPSLQTKETLLTDEELAPFKMHSSRLAALDYTVCLHSEAFVTTQGGNFPHFLIGHRRFLNKGYAKTIRPDKRKLVQLLDRPSISWESFSKHLQAMQRHNDVKGHEMRKSSASIYTYPAPDCMCLENPPPPPKPRVKHSGSTANESATLVGM